MQTRCEPGWLTFQLAIIHSLLNEKDNGNQDETIVDASNAIDPAPRDALTNDEAEEAGSDCRSILAWFEYQFCKGHMHVLKGLTIKPKPHRFILRACRWKGNMSQIAYKPVT